MRPLDDDLEELHRQLLRETPDACADLGRVYDALRKYVHNLRRRMGLHSSLQTTDLTNEALLRMARAEPEWQGPAAFWTYFQRSVVSLERDRARRRDRRVPESDAEADELEEPGSRAGLEEVEVRDALRRLAQIDAEIASVVLLRTFGLQHTEIGEALSFSRAKSELLLRRGKAWLQGRV